MCIVTVLKVSFRNDDPPITKNNPINTLHTPNIHTKKDCMIQLYDPHTNKQLHQPVASLLIGFLLASQLQEYNITLQLNDLSIRACNIPLGLCHPCTNYLVTHLHLGPMRSIFSFHKNGRQNPVKLTH